MFLDCFQGVSVRLKAIICSALVVFGMFAAGVASAGSDSFRINKIHFVGLLRIPSVTALSYLPVKAGGRYEPKNSQAIIHSLYHTGYFSDVNVYRQNNNLVIKVKEWPTIGKIRIDGNKKIKSKGLDPVMKNMGVEVGKTFNPNKLNNIVQGLTQQYENMGYSSVAVSPSTKALPHNRVAIIIHVTEGKVATLRSIRFEGNDTFSSRHLRGVMTMSKTGILSWFSNNDHFSEFSLEKDFKALRKYYLNKGYLKVKVEVKKVDKRAKGVYLTIAIHEGQRFRISGFQVTGRTLGQESQLLKLVDLHVGGYYSQKDLLASKVELSHYVANKGYAFPHINAIPKINELAHTVSYDFNILPGAHIYVRKIAIEGNYRTKDAVIRRELRQLEGALYSPVAIARSKQRLMLLGYFQTVTINHDNVDTHPGFVDLKVKVKEMRTGSARVQAGYDTAYGIVYGASISEKNFLGSGDGVSIGFENNAVVQNYNIGFSQPYYRPNGMSRSFQVFYTRVSNKPEFNLDSSYQQDGYGLSANYGLPLTENSSFNFGYGYENVNINNVIIDNSDPFQAAPSVLSYLALPAGKTSRTYNNFTLTGGWSYNNLDRAVFPTMGFANTVSAVASVPVLASSAPYYIGSYSAQWFEPLYKGFVFSLRTTLQYGSGFGGEKAFPFFKNFYLGGIGSIPGYEPNSLGPWNQRADTAMGGNAAAVFNANLILPEFISPKIRTLLTLSAGNVFDIPRSAGDLADSDIVDLEKPSLSNLRTSVGIMLEWYSPMGMIDLSFAVPLNKKANDQEKIFDFSFGTAF
jgi:outer membrane protein insertion porin family